MKSILKIVLCCVVFLFQQQNADAQCLPLQRGSNSNAQIFKTTGVAKFDEYLNTEKKYLESIFAVKVKMRILDDSGSPNAYATKESDNPLSFDGSVYLGVNLIANEIKTENGLASVNGIMAHEFAHILQEKLKCTLEGARRELHADFLAGYYMGRRGTYTSAEISAFGLSIYSKGDADIWSEAHHGTPEQRLSALLAGYRTAALTESPSDAYYAGIAVLDEDGGLGGGDSTQPQERERVAPAKSDFVATINGVKYSAAYSIAYQFEGISYDGLLYLENGAGVMRLKFNAEIVEETMNTETTKEGTAYFKGSNPIDATTRLPLKTYLPDNFFFKQNASTGENEVWLVDANLKPVKVETALIKDLELAQKWMTFLKW